MSTTNFPGGLDTFTSDIEAALVAVEGVVAGPVFYNPIAFGAQRGMADIAKPFDAALASAALTGGVVLIPPGTWPDSGGHVLPPAVQIWGVGPSASVIQHSGLGPWLVAEDNLGQFFDRRRFQGFSLHGNADPSAVGIQMSDAYYASFSDLHIQDYTNGSAFLLKNVNAWTEGLLFLGLHVQNSLVAFDFQTTATSSMSFAECRFLACQATLERPGAIGIRFGAGAYLYAAELRLKFNLTDPSAVCVSLDGTPARPAQVQGANVDILAETTGGGTGILAPAGTVWRTHGMARFGAGMHNAIDPGCFLVPDQPHPTRLAWQDGEGATGIQHYTAAHTLGASDAVSIDDASAAPYAVTLPDATRAIGVIYTIKRANGGPNAVTLLPQGGQTIDGQGSVTLSAAGAAVTVQSDDTTWWVLSAR